MRPRTRTDLMAVALDGELVVLDGKRGDLHHLNSTATLVFERCDGRATAAEIAGDLAEAYGRPRDQTEREVRALLRQLRRVGLLEPSGRAPASNRA